MTLHRILGAATLALALTPVVFAAQPPPVAQLVPATSEISFVTRQMGVPVKGRFGRFNCYMNPMLQREVCGGDFATTIKRSQWGMKWGIDMGIPDDVRLVVQVEAVKQ